VFDGDDSTRPAVTEAWRTIVDSDAALHTSSYVVVELTALLQGRLGLAAVDALATFVMPWVKVSWVDNRTHEQAVAALLAAGRPDCPHCGRALCRAGLHGRAEALLSRGGEAASFTLFWLKSGAVWTRL
jgi:hypothetical protein